MKPVTGLTQSLRMHFYTQGFISGTAPGPRADQVAEWLDNILAGDGSTDIDRLREALDNDYPLGFIDGTWAPPPIEPEGATK